MAASILGMWERGVHPKLRMNAAYALTLEHVPMRHPECPLLAWKMLMQGRTKRQHLGRRHDGALVAKGSFRPTRGAPIMNCNVWRYAQIRIVA